MATKRCPKGTKKNKQGECVKKSSSPPSTELMPSSNSNSSLRRKSVKNRCIRSKKTKRCKKSFRNNETSNTCKLFNKTQRCRGVKQEKFIEYKNYKVKKDVKAFLVKKIGNVSLEQLIASAEKDPDYEDTLQFVLEDKRKSESQIKTELENEILELSENNVRDNGFEVITMKSIKHVLKQNAGFKFLLD